MIQSQPRVDAFRQMNKNSAAYIPFGSFQHPVGQHTTQVRYHHHREPLESQTVTPPPLEEAVTDHVHNHETTSKPLCACPKLPRPNEEMKYFSWNSVKRVGSTVNLMQMTHHDHNPSKVQIDSIFNDAELKAAITLTSCFNDGAKPC